MTNQTLKYIFLAALWLVVSGFSKEQSTKNLDAKNVGQPSDERKAQDNLPKSSDPMWNLLAKTKIHLDEKQGLYSATFPPEIKALVGKTVTIAGFMLPLESTEKFKHFLISKRTPTCPFCPPGEPNEIADVWLESDTKWDEDMVKVSGTFELMENAELGLFFKISHAKRQ